MAKPTSPKILRLLSLSGNRNGSSIDISGLTSAVALANLSVFHFSGSLAGATSTSNSVRAAVPRNERPGPPSGSRGSGSNSSRKAWMTPGSSWASGVTTLRVGA